MLHKTFTPFPILKTERLILRQLASGDEQEIFILRSDNEINKYLDRKRANSMEDARNFITMINDNTSKNNSVYWAITLNNGDDLLIGTICLYDFSDEHDHCEIGYELLPNFQAKGIMREALGKILDYAFNTIKVKTVEAFFHKDNQRSIKLLEQFNFKHSAEPGQTEDDVVCYSLNQ